MAQPHLSNETDVREDVAAPFLRALGYARGTENDIERERFLRYDALQLGRKKSNDQPLGGKADYLLTVTGAGRWVLETKGPEEEIDLDAIDQTISYARHPEVCAHYAAILNGRRFVVFDRSQSANDRPLVDIAVESGEALARSMESLLSTAAIRRDCGPPVVDLSKPLATGFRSKANIIGGEIVQIKHHWEVPDYLPPAVVDTLSAETQKLPGLISNVNGGYIWRDESSRIRAQLKWSLAHEAMAPFMQASNFEAIEFICLDDVISGDPETPSIFEAVGAFRIEAGVPVFNLLRHTSQVMQYPIENVILSQATGFLRGDTFAGIAVMRLVMRTPLIPDPIIFHNEIKFAVRVDTK